MDNFERGLATIPEDDKATPVAEGMDKIYRQLTKVLEDVGVKEIDACGKEFNPDYHNAVMHVEDEAFGEPAKAPPVKSTITRLKRQSLTLMHGNSPSQTNGKL